jgi:hypothetical protein
MTRRGAKISFGMTRRGAKVSFGMTRRDTKVSFGMTKNNCATIESTLQLSISDNDSCKKDNYFKFF